MALFSREPHHYRVSYCPLNLLLSLMIINVKNLSVPKITCSNCQACCCSLEVRIISDTGVPNHHIYVDVHGHESMLRLDDGMCSALNRDTLLCSIYDNRPWVCREFEMGSYECIDERNEKL